MAITAVNAVYATQGPTASGQILADGARANAEVSLVFTGTVTLDGASTSFTLNFIDGTQTLSFTPTAIFLGITGGTEPTVPAIKVSAITTTGCTVNISGAGTAANTIKITGFILR